MGSVMLTLPENKVIKEDNDHHDYVSLHLPSLTPIMVQEDRQPSVSIYVVNVGIITYVVITTTYGKDTYTVAVYRSGKLLLYKNLDWPT